MLERDYNHTRKVAGAAELIRSARINGDGKIEH
jgi:hypothetical protein